MKSIVTGAFCLVGLLAAGVAGAGENLIFNGSFEEEPTTTLANYEYVTSADAVPGWTFVANSSGIPSVGNHVSTWYKNASIPDGKRIAFVQDNHNTQSISQKVNISEAGVYELSFWYAARSTHKGQSVTVSVGEQVLFQDSNNQQSDFVKVSKYLFYEEAPGEQTLKVTGASSSDNASVFDDFQLVRIGDTLTHTFAAGDGGSVSPSSVGALPGVQLTVTATPDDGYRFLHWEGELPEGVSLTDAEISFKVPDHPVSLTAIFASNVAMWVAPNGSDDGDGSSDKPFASIAKAVATAGEGGFVKLAAGTYPFASTLDINLSVQVKGATGNFRDVILDAGNARQAVILSAAGASLEDVTVTGGKLGNQTKFIEATGAAGVTVCAGAALRRCRVTNCTTGDFVPAAGVCNRGGLVEDCTIDGNRGGSGIASLTLGLAQFGQGAVVTGTTISNNVADLYHYNIGGSYPAAGAWIAGGRMTECLVAFNGYGRDSQHSKTDLADAHAAVGVALSGGSIDHTAIVSNSLSACAGLPRMCPGLFLAGGSVDAETVRVYGNLDYAGVPNDVKGTIAQADSVAAVLAAQPEYPVPSVTPREIALDEATAGEDLAAAIGELADGLTVRLAPGTYKLKSTLVLDRDVKIIGTNRETTVITAASGTKIRLVEIRERPNALLAGVKLTGGHAKATLNSDNSQLGIYAVDGYGANVWINGAGVVSNCVSETATFDRFASGILGAGDGGTFVDCVFRNEHFVGIADAHDAHWGGALLLTGGTVADRCVVSNIHISVIHTGFVSAAVELRGGELRNSLVTDCVYDFRSAGAGQSAAIRIDRPDARYPRRIVNCTVTGNALVKDAGGAGIVAAAGTSEVVNTIVVGNTHKGVLGNWVTSSSCTWTRNCAAPIEGLTLNAGNVEPPASLFESGTYGLPFDSPLRNYGAVEGWWMADGRDLAGAPRLNDDRTGVDLGAYQFHAGALNLTLTATDGKVAACERLDTTLTVEADVDEVSFSWDLDGDGVFESEGGSTRQVSLTEYGAYEIRVKGVDSSGNVATARLTLTVSPETIFVKAGNEANARAPYATWDTAAASLPMAIESAIDGGTVMVGPGDYRTDSPIRIMRPLTVVSSEGPSKTSLYGRGDHRVLELGVSGLLFAGFTVSNGYVSATVKNNTINNIRSTQYVGGGDLYIHNGAVASNCAFVAASGARLAGGLCVFNGGGTVTHSVIGDSKPPAGDKTTNSSAVYYGVGLLQYDADAVTEFCTIRNCTIEKIHHSPDLAQAAGAQVMGGQLRNCLVIGNRATDGLESVGRANAGGILLMGGTADHCTVVGNSGGTFPGGVNVSGGALKNSLVWDNDNVATDSERNVRLASGSVTYTSTDAVLTGEGNLAVRPDFQADKSWAYLSNSKCAHAGENRGWLGWIEPLRLGLLLLVR